MSALLVSGVFFLRDVCFAGSGVSFSVWEGFWICELPRLDVFKTRLEKHETFLCLIDDNFFPRVLLDWRNYFVVANVFAARKETKKFFEFVPHV